MPTKRWGKFISPQDAKVLVGFILVTGLFFLNGTTNSLHQQKEPEEVNAQVRAAATIDLCSAEGDLTLNEGDVPSYAGDDIFISGCTFTINGAHSFNSLTIGDGIGVDDSILRQSTTTSSTVYTTELTIAGTTTIFFDGEILMDARGFPGGYTSDGLGGATTTGASTGQTGGSYGGRGGEDTIGAPGDVYGSLTQPIEPGGGSGSSNGGGYIRLITDDLNLVGSIEADGGSGVSGGGAGGGIWITTTGTLTGSGTISATGGPPVNQNQAGGGGGRIAFYYDSSQPGNGSMLPYTLSAWGGDQPAGGGTDADGGAGTIYIEDIDTHTAGQGEVEINGGASTIAPVETVAFTPIPDGIYADIRIRGDAFARNQGIITINNDLFFDTRGNFAANTLNISGDLNITNGGSLTHTRSTSSTVYRLTVTVTGDTTIDSTSFIDTDAKGFELGYTSDGGGGTTTTNAATSQAGASHGGVGGDDPQGAPGLAYDSLSQPVDPGGSGANAGRGGGYLRLITTDLDLEGEITADSPNSSLSGGAGGGIWITTTGSLTGIGTISANAGDAVSSNYGAGGGGRIALYYDSSQPGNGPATPYTFEALGGDQPGDVLQDGGAGTVYIEDTNTHSAGEGDVFINNGSADVVGRERLSETEIPNGTYDDLTIQGDASVKNLGTITLNGDLFFDTRGEFAAATLNIGGDLTITDGGNLTHRRASTTDVYRLTVTVTGNTSVDATSTIDTNAKGFEPGYTSDGLGGTTTTDASTGQAGGSHGGVGGDDVTGAPGVAYGSLTQPDEPGAGAGANQGRGGGAIRLITTDLNILGSITANSNDSTLASAAGGSVWITTTGSLTGSGTVSTNAGAAVSSNYAAGAGGRVAFYYDSSQPGNGASPPYTFQALGGDQPGATAQDGGAGTVYVEDTNTHTSGQGNIFINNGAADVVGIERLSETELPDGTFNNLTIGGDASVKNLGTINLNGDLFFDTRGEFAASTLTIGGDLSITDNSNLTHRRASTTTVYRLNVTVSGTTMVDATSLIDLTGKGFQFDYTSDGLGGTTTLNAAANQGGGSHGGRGGDDPSGFEGEPYDNFLEPADPGGGSGNTSGRGGGYMRLITEDLNLIGDIDADAGGTTVAGGAGGGLWITVNGSMTGSGSIKASGAAPGNSNYAGGGGGMIALYFDSSQSGNSSVPPYAFEAYGGDNPSASQDGAAGTIFLKDSQETNGDLIIDNNNLDSNRYTPLFVNIPAGLPMSYTVRNLSVINEAQLRIDSPCSGTALTVNGATDLSGNGLINVIGASGCTTSFAALAITAALPNGNINTAYSEQVESPGGYAPKTFECLDGLGGSVVACNVASGWPAGLTMSATGAVTGTPTAGGNFSPIIRVTDSDPGGAVVAEQTLSLFINSAPNSPTLVSPADASQVGTTTPTLSAQYSDGDVGDTGTTDYRISSGSAGDCLSNTNIVDSGTSATTSTNNEATTYVVGTALTHSATYNWCARNNDGAVFSDSGNFTTMGSFTVNLGNAPNDPVLIAPGNTDTTNLLSPLLEATYSDPDGGDVGTTEFRVSSGSSADCLSNVNVVFSGASATTATNNETASVTVGIALTDLTTYNWCARNNDGVFTSNSGNFTTMGSFLVDTSFTPGGGIGTILQNQQQNNGGGGGSDAPDQAPQETAEIQSFGVDLSFKDINGNEFPTRLVKGQILFGTLVLTNTNGATANDVFANLPIPNVVSYVPGSLQISGKTQTDEPDEDAGQANQNAVSGIWSSLGPNATKTVKFQLLPNPDSNTAAIVAAIEIISLQASVSASNADDTFQSDLLEYEIETDTEIPVSEPDQPEESEPENEFDPEEDVEQPTEPDTTPEESQPEVQPPVEQPESIPTPDPTPPPLLDTQSTPQPVSPIIPLTPDDSESQQDQEADSELHEELFITGTVQSQNEQIQFSGTVSEPNTTVTVVINGQTFTFLSDENGLWQAFVSAEQLGIQQNTSQQVSIEVYAVNTETGEESNRIAQQIFVERFTDELIVEPIAVTISSNALITVFDQVQGQVQDLIEEREEEIQTTLAVAAPVVIASSIPLWGYLPYLPTMLFHLINSIIGLIGRKKQKDEHFYGVVYDSITKQPLSLAVIRIYRIIDSEPGVHETHSRQLVKTVVSDKSGRYEALLDPGTYEFDVKKPQFSFPSRVVTSAPDGVYSSIYSGRLSGESISIPDIPLDQVNAPKKWQTANFIKKLWLMLQKVGRYLAVPLLFVGAFTGVLVLLADTTNPINWVLAFLYILLLVMQITFRTHPEKAWGIVYDLVTNAPVPLTTLQLIEPEFGKVVSSRLSDHQGRFSFLPEPGKYVIKANKEGYKQAEVIESDNEHSPLTGEVLLEKTGQRITGDIALIQE